MVEILEAGLQGADPYANVRELVRLDQEDDGTARRRLVIGGGRFEPRGDPRSGTEVIDLSRVGRVFVFGAGKGVQRAARALEDILGDRLTGGHVIDKKGHPVICEKIGVTLGGHPVPDADCVRGCEAILDMCGGFGPDDLVFMLAGNGISSLLTLPAPGITLEDIQETTRILQIERGVPTPELNAVRNHLDRLKGGRITRALQPARVIHLILADPSSHEALMRKNFWLHGLPDCTTFAGAAGVLESYGAADAVPAAVEDFLRRAPGEWETVKADEFEGFAPWRLFGLMPSGSDTGLFPSAMRKARELGFNALFLAENLWFVEASQAGAMAGCIAREIESGGQPVEPPVALFSGGEMVVSVGQDGGVGGRDQEYAVAAALRIAGSENIVIGSVDTDGTDGPGVEGGVAVAGMPWCLAGGIVDGHTRAEIEAAGLDPAEGLKRHNTSPVLWAAGCGVDAEPGVSAQDLTVVLVLARGGEKQSATSVGVK